MNSNILQQRARLEEKCGSRVCIVQSVFGGVRDEWSATRARDAAEQPESLVIGLHRLSVVRVDVVDGCCFRGEFRGDDGFRCASGMRSCVRSRRDARRSRLDDTSSVRSVVSRCRRRSRWLRHTLILRAIVFATSSNDAAQGRRHTRRLGRCVPRLVSVYLDRRAVERRGRR